MTPAGHDRYATFLWRLLAMIIDTIVLLIPTLIIGVTLGMLLAALDLGFTPATTELIGNFVGVLIGWLYYAMMESSPRQATFGKAVCKLRVTDLHGERISFLRATGRYFGKIVSTAILLIGYFMVLFTARKQGLHDMMANTLVMKNAPSSV